MRSDNENEDKCFKNEEENLDFNSEVVLQFT